MKAEYKRDLQNNYLILEAADTDTEEHYGLRMAEQNQVKGLLPMHESRKDGKLYLHYEITSKQTLESMYEKKVMGYQDILYILSGIRDILENMRKYLLSPQQLLFAPEMIYVQPERKKLLLCYYVKEDECPIRILAEFILKRLDHRDRQAVALGYGFFERASADNFSLAEALKEILATFESAKGNVESGAKAGAEAGVSGGYRQMSEAGVPGGYRQMSEAGAPGGYRQMAEAGVSGGYRQMSEAGVSGGYRQMAEAGVSGGYRQMAEAGAPGGYRQTAEAEPSEKNQIRYGVQEEPYVIHRERNRKSRKEEKNAADRIFTKVHPAVLLSFLALTVVLEILMICEMLSLTESGGCFFLMLSIEILLNRRLLHKGNPEPEEWDEEEENEEYQKMLQEVYQERTAETDPEPIEETRCLIPQDGQKPICLICRSGNEKENYPEIHPGYNPIYVGKIKGDADVLLNVSTVSRMHARIQMRQGRCFLKDMNSKNGTFVNGRRLEPQEECEIQEADMVAFAQIEYQVAKRDGIY